MVSKFFGVVALVILVQYVIAEGEPQTATLSTPDTESPSATQACLPSADLKVLDYQTFKQASDVNDGLSTPDLTFQGLKQDLETWGKDETNAQKKTDFLSKLDTTYQGKPTEYQNLRTLLIEADEAEHKSPTTLSSPCKTSSTTPSN